MGTGNGGLLDGLRRIPGKFRELVIDGGIPGAPLGLRLRGATSSGPPAKGTWKAGDEVRDRTGRMWVCTYGGTPGRWSGSQVALSPSGDQSGVTDAAAIALAISQLPALGGTVRLAATGTWYVKCGVVTASTGAYIACDPGAYIYAVGAGDCFRFVDTSNYADRTLLGGAGISGFPVIDGTHTTGNSCAVHGGDILQLGISVQAANFTAGTTSKGVWWDNQYWFTEQAYGRIYTINCTSAMVIDSSANVSGQATSSYARADIDVYLAQIVDNVSQQGVVMQNGVVIYDGHLGIYGNMVTTSAATAVAVLTITGVGAGGSNTNYSSINNSELVIGVESDTAEANGPMTINFGSSNNEIYECWGALDFPYGNFTASNLPGQECFVYTGVIEGDTTLEQYGWSFQSMISAPAGLMLGQYATATTISANATTISVGQVTSIRLTSSAAYTGLILNNVGGLYEQVVTLINEGNYPLTFAVPATSSVAAGFVIPAGSRQTYAYDHFTGFWYPFQTQEFTAYLASNVESTSTTLANVTGLAAYLSVGTWKIRAYLPVEAVTAGTAKFAFSFSGTASTPTIVAWQGHGSTFEAPLVSATLTTENGTGVTTSTTVIYYMECTATVTVSAAGTLQVQHAEGATGNTFNTLAGAFLEVTQVG